MPWSKDNCKNATNLLEEYLEGLLYNPGVGRVSVSDGNFLQRRDEDPLIEVNRRTREDICKVTREKGLTYNKV